MNARAWSLALCAAMLGGCEPAAQPKAPAPASQPVIVRPATTAPSTTATRPPKIVTAKPPQFPQTPPAGATNPARQPATAPASQPASQPADPFPGVRGVDAASFGQPIENPLANIGPEYKAAMKLKGLDLEPLAKLKAYRITGEHVAAYAKTFVNKRPDVLLVFGPAFITHGDVYSAGPILAIGDAQFGGDITGKGLIWLAENARPPGVITGGPIILAPSVKLTTLTLKGETWLGDYGWRPKESGK